MTDVQILDGGMGRQLARIGAPFRMPEWSALALIEAPDYVTEAHRQFIDAGAEIITTNSYSILPHQIGNAYFAGNGERLADLAGRLARQAAGSDVRVAGSLPPLFGSYKPQLFAADRAPAIIAPLIRGLAPHIDHWLIETQSSLAEASTAINAVRETEKPFWVSFTVKDGTDRRGAPALRSGESISHAVDFAAASGAAAILFNCSQPEAMGAALQEARDTLTQARRADLPLGVYANIFTPEPESDAAYAGISGLRADVVPQSYLDFVQTWIKMGARIVGGCCGIGPEHIAEIAAYLKKA